MFSKNVSCFACLIIVGRLILTLQTLEINKINKHIQNRNKATMYDVSESFFTFYRQMVMLLDSFKILSLPHLCAGQECLGSPRWGPMLPMFFGGWVLVVGWCMALVALPSKGTDTYPTLGFSGTSSTPKRRRLDGICDSFPGGYWVDFFVWFSPNFRVFCTFVLFFIQLFPLPTWVTVTCTEAKKWAISRPKPLIM